MLLLCEKCSINSCRQNFRKIAEKKLNVLKNCSLKIFTFIEKRVRNLEAVFRKCSLKKMFLKFLKIYRKTPVPESLAQVFPCEFCEISKNTFF